MLALVDQYSLKTLSNVSHGDSDLYKASTESTSDSSLYKGSLAPLKH